MMQIDFFLEQMTINTRIGEELVIEIYTEQRMTMAATETLNKIATFKSSCLNQFVAQPFRPIVGWWRLRTENVVCFGYYATNHCQIAFIRDI